MKILDELLLINKSLFMNQMEGNMDIVVEVEMMNYNIVIVIVAVNSSYLY